jgi:hypothetical protein
MLLKPCAYLAAPTVDAVATQLAQLKHSRNRVAQASMHSHIDMVPSSALQAVLGYVV